MPKTSTRTKAAKPAAKRSHKTPVAHIAKATPCICCGGTLDNFDPTGNQPIGGLSFTTPGHWASSAFDAMDGTVLEINVCDACLKKAADKDRVLIASRQKTFVKAVYGKWKFPERLSAPTAPPRKRSRR